MVRAASARSVCKLCVFSQFLGSCLVSGVRDKIGCRVCLERRAMSDVGCRPGPPLCVVKTRGGPGPGLTVNTSPGSHCRGSVHRAARSPEQGAELGEGGGHSTCVTSNSPPLREFYVEIMKTIFVMRFLNYGHNSPSATSIDKIQQASVTQVLLSIELFNTSILVAA